MPMLGLVTAVASLLLPATPPASNAVSRRTALQQAAGVAVFGAAALPASAAEDQTAFSKLGGLLEPFIDTQKGYKLYKPSGWNEFTADPGVYDMKWADIIEPETTVQVSTSPVATATSVNALGELDEVAAKFAKSRDAKVVKAYSREAVGSLIYTFELQGEQYHEILALAINRGKLYRVTTVTSNKKWDKRSKLYTNIVNSFVPQGF